MKTYYLRNTDLENNENENKNRNYGYTTKFIYEDYLSDFI